MKNEKDLVVLYSKKISEESKNEANNIKSSVFYLEKEHVKNSGNFFYYYKIIGSN